MDPRSGDRLGPYEIVRAIGSGGMGTVFQGIDTRLGRAIAIKISREEFTARFEREARAVAALNHPHVCTLYDVGPNYLVMELVEGRTLAERIAEGPLPATEAVRIARQIADALAAAHSHGIVHRDLKPANVKITPGGAVKVLDFGLAKLVERAVPDDGATITADFATRAGVMVGTAPYMSPEQIKAAAVDCRTDLWSLGIVLHEMLAGRRPFDGVTPFQILSDILERPLPRVPGIPPELQPVLDKLVQKDRTARYRSAAELIADLDRMQMALTAPAAPVIDMHRLLVAARRPRTLIAAVVLAGICCAIGAAWVQRQSRIRWARNEAVPQARALAERAEYVPAYRLASAAERLIAGDPALDHLWQDVSQRASVRSSPAGALVTWKPYAGSSQDWQRLGVTPIVDHRLPAGAVRFRLELAGYLPLEIGTNTGSVEASLLKQSALVSGMVHVPAGDLHANYPGIGLLDARGIEPFEIDRKEVTNRQFKEFVDGGGYTRREYWRVPFSDGRVTLSWEQAMSRFVDATGRPGPATWDAGSYAEEEDNYPVSGVSWYEAAAYAAFRGKSLPTVHHWFRAANTDSTAYLLPLSNFSGRTASPVGNSGAVGTYGTVDMAGNVREWCWNESTDGRRYILGGSWADPSYMLSRGEAVPAFDRGRTNGIRCVRYHGGLQGRTDLSAAVPPAAPPPYLSAPPASDEVFQLYRAMYTYEKSDLAAQVESVDDSSTLWRRERIRFRAGYDNDHVIAQLFLPKTARPPYQCVVWFPEGSAFRPESSDAIRPETYLLRSGRAILYPVFQGMLDRFKPVTFTPLLVRDALIMWRQDLSRAYDYLETRSDIDATKLAYLGGSMGAEVGPIMLALDGRPRAAVLLSGGLTWRLGPLPEMNVVNFLPRVTTPTLMVNGRYDAILPVDEAQKPMFVKLGTAPAEKRHVILEGGHWIGPEARNQMIREVLDWLDRYLGPQGTQ